MEKNIIIVYGLLDYRKKYLLDMNETQGTDIYITMDDLFDSSNIIGVNSCRENLTIITNFLMNNGKSGFLREEDKNPFVNDFYQMVRNRFSEGNEAVSKTIKKKIDIDTVKYLLHSISVFFSVHLNQPKQLNQLSLSATLNRRKENISKSGNRKEYKDYRAGFLTKNMEYNKCRHLYSNEILKNKKYDKRSGEGFISQSRYGNHDIFNRNYTSDIFDSFVESDKKGFEKISKYIDYKNEHYKTATNEDKEMFSHCDLIGKCFSRAFIRKLSKKSIDWAEQEASDIKSPIKKIIFYIEDNAPPGSLGIYNMNVENFHHRWRNSNPSDIGNLKNLFPITYSELKYAIELMQRKPNHHIELVSVNKSKKSNKFSYAQKIFNDL
ncbi:hypothetical protein Xbed_03331 [Xenorhabdus beddingii]|uniref:Uncharacterized protein n=1 Tax=Xenorhabdus beddingii TaxID=40578 RepID=A0A1Y2SIL1_9GAMM|nr:hypothetical protein [Xenorhabdus beddingii]OTA17424.1 hypothetical protein Xbed_03331 [Xenorhabdus beddingii]